MEQKTRKRSRQLRLQGILEGKVFTGPRNVHIDLANGCNTNCTTCWDHSPLLTTPRSNTWKRQYFPLSRFLELVDDLESMNSVEAVILSGMGDPFVNPHVYEMIRACKEKGWEVTVLTNALLADPEKILALDVDMMLISVNGVSPASYTAFHPNLHERDFQKLIRQLQVFATAGKRFKHVQVINRDTAEELAEMVRFASRYQARQITYKLASLGAGTEACAVTSLQKNLLKNRWIPEAREEAMRLGVSTNLDVLEAQVSAGGFHTAPIEDIGCFMGWSYARITVSETILFCCATEVEVGSLQTGSFSAQWYGKRWNQTRNRLMNGEYYASCSQCGKLNQNIKIAAKVKELLGENLYLSRIGGMKQSKQFLD